MDWLKKSEHTVNIPENRFIRILIKWLFCFTCSPSQGGCCDQDLCKPVTDARQCRPQTDCAAAANCTYPFCKTATL